jgi:hypothetical protein
MKLVEEIAFLIDYLIEADQPTEEIAQQVVNLIRTKDINDIIA